MKIIFKKIAVLAVVLTTVAITSMSFAASHSSTKKSALTPLDRIVAVVNSDIITQTQLDQQFNLAKKQLQAMHAPLPADEQLRKQILQQLIDHNLQLSAAKRAGITVTRAEVDKAIDTIAQRNHLSTTQLSQAIKQQGINYSVYQQQIHDQMVISKLQQQALGGSVTVTQADIDKFGKSGQVIDQATSQYHLRDLVVPLPNSPSPTQIAAARAKANNLIQQLRSGTNFQTVTKAQAVKGTDLGWRHLSDLPSLFAQQVVNMKEGDISEPVQAPNGFHILQLAGLKASSQQLNQQQIHQLIFERKLQEKITAWLQQLRSNAYIKIMN